MLTGCTYNLEFRATRRLHITRTSHHNGYEVFSLNTHDKN